MRLNFLSSESSYTTVLDKRKLNRRALMNRPRENPRKNLKKNPPTGRKN